MSQHSPAAPAQAGGEFLTFAVYGETFAIEVERVREVVDPPPVTAVPNAPDFAPGLVNVRGNIVAVVDLRRRFVMPCRDPGEGCRLIVAEVPVAGEPTLVGILADAVHQVVDTARATIEELPRLGTRWRPDFTCGVAKQDGEFIILLNIERILANDCEAPATPSGSH